MSPLKERTVTGNLCASLLVIMEALLNTTVLACI